MITINYKDESYKLKNSFDEFVINEYEQINELLLDQEKDIITKWISVLLYLGLPEYVINDLEEQDLINIIEGFSLDFNSHTNLKVKKEIKLNDEKFYCYDKKFFLTVKQCIIIEDILAKHKSKYFAELLDVIYQNPSSTLSKDIKIDLIRNTITFDIVLPIISYLSNYFNLTNRNNE